ncbi:MAG: hypothetical protein IPL73_23610 [Candidatus Obscuribacter sp.]|nr:hypothetical protein [Candidatus Obscuribacter sp.]
MPATSDPTTITPLKKAKQAAQFFAWQAENYGRYVNNKDKTTPTIFI